MKGLLFSLMERKGRFSALRIVTFQKTQGFSLLPAPVSQAKHLHSPTEPGANTVGSQMLSLISEHNPQGKRILDAGQAAFG